MAAGTDSDELSDFRYLLFIFTFKSIVFINFQCPRQTAVAKNFNLLRLRIHPFEQGHITPGTLLVPLAVNNEQGVPAGIFFGNKPEAILAVPVEKGRGGGIRRWAANHAGHWR